ncbi:hypothetical protein TIFTF001_020838 [Ficus carica]|uniref:Uncharacterized protein n=1 Tax=Ficus carica TaxID=3494 RepID=A0AA88DJP1_FICCA|nr:hypothetical protein TIFTF001_020838 [Ficus carica]
MRRKSADAREDEEPSDGRRKHRREARDPAPMATRMPMQSARLGPPFTSSAWRRRTCKIGDGDGGR